MNALIGLGIAISIIAIAMLYTIAMCKRSKKEQPKQPVKTIKYYDDEGNIYEY